MNEPFVKAHIIHDPADEKRQAVLEKEVSEVGINVQLWEPVVAEPVYVGIIRAHKQIVKFAKERGKEEILIGENDFHFPAGRKGLMYFVDNKPKGYDIYLAGVYVGRESLKTDRKLLQFSGMHFYFVHSRFYDKFLELDETTSLDNGLSVLAIMGLAEIYSLYPMAAIQHENVSATSGCVFNHKYYFNNYNVFGYGSTVNR